jgi:hypothetical protein
MAQSLGIVAQYAMDLYYNNYKEDSGFFELSDFVYHCGAESADYLRQEFKQKYDEMRSEKDDEVIDFSDDWLSYATINITNNNGTLTATLPQPIFSLPYDSQNTGIQDITITKPANSCVQLERTMGGAVWRLKYLPVTNDRIFWWLANSNQLQFYNPGINNIQQIVVEYVPSFSETSNIPDGIVSFVITNAVSKMNELVKGKIIKKGLDNSQNKILETEIDRRQIT